MRSLFLPLVTLASVLAIHVCPAAAGPEWPQWRGPLLNGVAPNANPPVTWSETNNIRWKVAVPGTGSSTPIISGKHLFLLATEQVAGAAPAPPETAAPAAEPGRRGGGSAERPAIPHRFTVQAWDRTEGKLLWQKTAVEEVPHEGHHRDHGFASGSPVTDGEHVYAWFGSRGLHAYDFAGNLKWSQRFGQMRTRMTFGEGTSPALHGDKLVILWDHEGEDFIAALDKHTGRELWRQPRNEATSWTTPLIITHNGVTQVLVNGSSRIRSYALADGKQLWECGGMTQNVIPMPVADADTAYFMSGFRGAAALAIKLGGSGDLTGTEFIRWSHNQIGRAHV